MPARSAAHVSRLAAIAQRGAEPAAAPAAVLDSCELCAEPIGPEHDHLLDLESGEVLCACQGCRILMGREGAGGRHYRLIGRRRRSLPDLRFDDLTFAALGIPVDMAFFTYASPAGRMRALYP